MNDLFYGGVRIELDDRENSSRLVYIERDGEMIPVLLRNEREGFTESQ